MAVQRHERAERVSFEEYLAIVDKDPEHSYEYLDGRVYMMTGGSPDHAIIGSNVGAILGNLLQERHCIVYDHVYVQLDEDHRVCPDVTVSCDQRDRGAQEAIQYPSLVVEVLSPSTEARDRGKKSLQYRAHPTIREYLLVSTDEPLIELFRRENDNLWTIHTLGRADSVELASLSVRFNVADAYQDTSLLDEKTE